MNNTDKAEILKQIDYYKECMRNESKRIRNNPVSRMFGMSMSLYAKYAQNLKYWEKQLIKGVRKCLESYV